MHKYVCTYVHMHNNVILNTVDFIIARFLENDGVLLTLYLSVHFM